jgi:hypothetical protein
MTSVINLNPNVGDIGLTTDDNQNSTMCENTTSMCQENIYENTSEYRLNSDDKFQNSNEHAIQEIKQSDSKQQ